MSPDAYGTLAGVYEYLIPEEVLTPAGSVAEYAPMANAFAPGARVLDCSAGIGLLAIGLAQRGLDVVATDASEAMIERARELTEQYGVEVEARVCPWEELGAQGWDERFDVVFCTGNALSHANGREARRAALAQMAGVLRRGGLLVIDARNWERLRALGTRVEVDDRVRQRGSERALTIHSWRVGDDDDGREPLYMDAVIALIDEHGAVTTRRDTLRFCTFTHEQLEDDLRAQGFEPRSNTWDEQVGFYTVTAERR
jgi:SAM-dependent methyltransferase